MLSLENLTLTIGNKCLFKNLSITFLPSAIVHLQGTNGSGKTSLLRMIAGLQNPTSGDVFAGGRLTSIHNLQKPYCTYVGHNLGLKLELTVLENLKFWSHAYGSTQILEASIYYFNLQELLDKKCYELSAGNQKTVALSRLMSCHSNLWLLDEIEMSLDQQHKLLLYNLIISKANNGGIIVMTSHEKVNISNLQMLDLYTYA